MTNFATYNRSRFLKTLGYCGAGVLAAFCFSKAFRENSKEWERVDALERTGFEKVRRGSGTLRLVDAKIVAENYAQARLWEVRTDSVWLPAEVMITPQFRQGSDEVIKEDYYSFRYIDCALHHDQFKPFTENTNLSRSPVTYYGNGTMSFHLLLPKDTSPRDLTYIQNIELINKHGDHTVAILVARTATFVND